VEHSVGWHDLDAVDRRHGVSVAPGTAGHVPDMTVDFGDVAAKFVKITATSNHSGGMSKQCGLSEVRLVRRPHDRKISQPGAGCQQRLIPGPPSHGCPGEGRLITRSI